jgi:hypothetical protein
MFSIIRINLKKVYKLLKNFSRHIFHYFLYVKTSKLWKNFLGTSVFRKVIYMASESFYLSYQFCFFFDAVFFVIIFGHSLLCWFLIRKAMEGIEQLCCRSIPAPAHY